MILFTKTVILYHGSKSGINGRIEPKSRKNCDFGQGFYLGDLEDQPKGLISGKKFNNSTFYKVELTLDNLRVYEFSDPLLWALYISYHRGIMINIEPHLQVIFDKIDSYDVIVGLIADDSMVFVLQEFFANTLTDKALIEALSYVKLGKQYVLKTQRACDCVRILEETVLTDKEKQYRSSLSDERIKGMLQIVEQLRIKYLREGKYYIEILGGIQNETIHFI